MSLFEVLLTVQIFMGALDTLWHHELTERLPARATQRQELVWHAWRSALYGVLFLFLALCRPQGWWLLLPAALFAIELFITLADFVEEDRSRLLPATERVLHTILAINAGALMLAYALERQVDWQTASTITWRPIDAFSVLLLASAVAVSISAARDAIACRSPTPMTHPLLPQRTLRVLVTGGSGFIGSELVRRLLLANHEVTVLTRDPRRTSLLFEGRIRALDRIDLIDGQRFDLIVNLAGAPVVGVPWTKGRRKILWASRVGLTRALVAQLAKTPRSDQRVFVQASAMGYYGQRANSSAEHDAAGTDFAGQLCAAWEDAADLVRETGYRLVVLRLGLVMGEGGGILAPLRLSAKLGGATVLGDGRQAFPWIHLDDVLAAIEKLTLDRRASGAYNLCAPEAVDQATFTRALAKSLRRPAWLRTPAWPLKLALGDMSDMLLHSPPATCGRLLEAGFVFRRPRLAMALA
ncbi:MAG: TIGR01777 family protein [Ahniella sp.]|nr:TIGR01777 family protein [Ahniella sp.]